VAANTRQQHRPQRRRALVGPPARGIWGRSATSTPAIGIWRNWPAVQVPPSSCATPAADERSFVYLKRQVGLDIAQRIESST